MTPELAELRKALQAIPYRGGRRRYPEALKARVVAYHQARRAAGALCREVASELGLSRSQLSEWSRPAGEAGFLAVQLQDDIDPCQAAEAEAVTNGRAELPPDLRVEPEGSRPAGRSPLLLTSPAGWRIEGLELESLMQLLEHLS
ncbi:MAG: transposase [Myxococcota bacterium]